VEEHQSDAHAQPASDLILEELTIEGHRATVFLSGNLLLGGECDIPRVKEQIRETVLRVPTVTKADVSINGIPLEEVLSARG
jgi:hypothetical protein